MNSTRSADLGNEDGAAPTQPQTAPGWYPKPSNPEESAYWDGESWMHSAQTAEAPAVSIVPLVKEHHPFLPRSRTVCKATLVFHLLNVLLIAVSGLFITSLLGLADLFGFADFDAQAAGRRLAIVIPVLLVPGLAALLGFVFRSRTLLSLGAALSIATIIFFSTPDIAPLLLIAGYCHVLFDLGTSGQVTKPVSAQLDAARASSKPD